MARWLLVLAASTSALAASSALAQDGAVRIAHDSITRGDLSHAERVLRAEQRVFPQRPEVLVNLAAVYAATGRAAEATALYRRVLAGEDMLLDLSGDRSASSHRIAQVGLRRLAGLQTAAR